jgi:3-oxoacyl-[acyl-carrier-protein] synthase-3
MGAEAARAALASAQVDPGDIDLVVTATSTPDGMFPAVASLIQDAIGARNAGAFDVNAACAGFLHAIATGAQFVATGSASRVLVVGTETMSRIVDWTDRGTCVLFGDGAGAVVLERAQVFPRKQGGIGSLLLRSDGSQACSLYAGGPAAAPATPLMQEARIVMDGPAVFRSAVTAMSGAAADALASAGLGVEDVALCIPHQANARILTAVARSIGLPIERVYVNLDRTGNTSSASIPIALSEASDQGRLRPGDQVLLAAFGGGLSWGAMALEWSGVRSPAPTLARPLTEPATQPVTEPARAAVLGD